MSTVDPVILQLRADIADYERNVTRAQKLSDTKLDAIEKKGAAMGTSLRNGFNVAAGAAVAFAGSIAVDKVFQAISAGLDYASSLGEVAKQLGVTTDALQEYRYAATQTGLSQEEMDQGLSQLTRRLGEAANGTKAQAEAFETLGIKVKDASGKVLDAGNAIPLIADALQKVESPAERAAILMDLFGRAGQKLEPLLAGGAKGVNGLRDAAHELGIVLSSEQIQKADDAADKLASVKTVLEARIAGVVADNADSIVDLANAFGELADKIIKTLDALNKFSKSPLGKALLSGQSFLNNASPGAFQFKVLSTLVTAPQAPAKAGPSNGGTGATKPSLFLPQAPGAKFQASKGSIFLKKNLAGSTSPFAQFANGTGVSGGAEAIGVDTESAKKFAPSAAKAVAAFQKFTGDLEGMAIELDLANAELTGSLEARAAAEKRRIDYDAAQDRERVAADDTITKEQKAQANILIEQTAKARKELVDKQLSADLAEKRAAAERENLDLEEAALSAQADAADTAKERYAIEQRLLDIQQQEERARLEAMIAAGNIADATKARAALERKQSAERRGLAQGQMGPGARYLSDLRSEAESLGDAYEGIAVDGLRNIEDGLTDTVKTALGLHGVLGDIVGDFIQLAIRMAIIKPLAESLFSGGGGGGGGILGSLLGIGLSAFGGGSIGGLASGIGSNAGSIASLFGRASGGYVAPGQMVRVNEAGAPGRVEGFMSRDGGQIIPLGQMNAVQGSKGTPGTATVRLELSGDIDARIQSISGDVAVEVVRNAAPQIVNAATANTIAKAQRPRM